MRTLDPEQQAQHHHESQVFYRGVFSSEASMEDVLREALLQDISESPQDLSESAGHRVHTFKATECSQALSEASNIRHTVANWRVCYQAGHTAVPFQPADQHADGNLRSCKPTRHEVGEKCFRW